MKVALVLVLAFAGVVFGAPEQYTNKYDNTNFREIIENERLLNTYHRCIMERGKCTPDGNELKSHIADALATECSKCTPPQRDGVNIIIEHLINKKPELWNELKGKYDPAGLYSQKYEKELKRLTKSR